MSKLVVRAFSLSIDGFGAGLDQDINNPIGRGGMGLHSWLFPTKTFQAMHGGQDAQGGEGDIDDEFAAKSFDNIGAWIMGRHMFGPVRGPWLNDDWKGWWGDNPPYHVPVFVLSHYERAPLVMDGGTTFYFVTDGIISALDQARKMAQGKDIRIGGGVSTVRQYLEAGLIDELHLVMSPVLLGAGEALFQGLDLPQLGYQSVEQVASAKVTHLRLVKDQKS